MRGLSSTPLSLFPVGSQFLWMPSASIPIAPGPLSPAPPAPARQGKVGLLLIILPSHSPIYWPKILYFLYAAKRPEVGLGARRASQANQAKQRSLGWSWLVASQPQMLQLQLAGEK